jgi:hypothetical protein
MSVFALLAPVALAGSAMATSRPVSTDRLDVYSGIVDRKNVQTLLDLGVDRRDLDVSLVRGDAGKLRIEAILSSEQAEDLEARGVDLDVKTVDGKSAAQRFSAVEEEQDDGVFRRYSGAGGLKEEMEAQAEAYPDITKLEVIGQTTNGQDIVAVKVGRNADTTRDGARPTSVYIGAQHAREWITPEMIRRLLDHVLTGYGNDARITRIVNQTDLWFIPVANPDGYDFTFEDGRRMWRKNLRDNNGDGQITTGDGVDLNRNYPYKWGYDNEGSSPDPASETYRGPAPGSEPETQAFDAFMAGLGAEFLVNYHSAAELLLHGIGWQVATPSPDDVLYEAMVGDDANPAVPGYDPDLSAELYTTNGDTDSHMQAMYGTLGFTPEMSTCEAASAVDPDDEWEPADCASGFHFPDDEGLIQAEFEKNIPFALAVAESALDPDDPVSVVGRDAEDFRVDTFDVSYGDGQLVGVWAKVALRDVVMRYRINGGDELGTAVTEWRGGERYGHENNDYYAELRGRVEGTKRGDNVEVWFEGYDLDAGETVTSESFTYTVQRNTGNKVLVIANEDYTGVNPTYPASVTGPKYLDLHVSALRRAGIAADTWDVDAQGIPHDLGVLSHYDTVLWYLGDNRLTQDPEDFITETYFGNFTDLSVAERQQYLTIAVRDFLNEGGKLILAGETAGYYGQLGEALGGIWYGLDGAPEEECQVPNDPFADCLILADDFTQYYLGAYERIPVAGVEGVEGLPGSPFFGLEAQFGGPATEDNPVDEVGLFTVTNDVLPQDEFPWFGESRAAMEYTVDSFLPTEGQYAAAALHEDESYFRLMRTFDLTGTTAAQSPRFEGSFSWNLETGYDNVIVEARVVGQDNWTTLPELNGATSTALPIECEAGFLLTMHPWLLRYLTPGTPCQPTGTSGSWNALTGSSGGWRDVAFDLSAYAGQQVELSISYVTDPSSGGIGLVVDDTRLRTTSGVRDAEGFENGFGAWTVAGAPAGSPAGGGTWSLTTGFSGLTSGVMTEDTLMLGFGLEQLASETDRARILGAAITTLDAPERSTVLEQLGALDDLVETLHEERRISATTAAGLHDRIERATEQFAQGREDLPIGYLEQFIARVRNQVRDAGARAQLIALAQAIIDDIADINEQEELPED